MTTALYAVVATFHIRADEIEAMRQLVADVTRPSLHEDGVEVYHWSQGTDDPAQFLLYMEWRDKTAFDAHVATPHVQRAEELLEDLLVEPAAERHYERVKS